MSKRRMLNHALQRTRRERRGDHRYVSCAGSLSLGCYASRAGVLLTRARLRLGMRERKGYAWLRAMSVLVLASAGACAVPLSRPPNPEIVAGCYEFSFQWGEDAQVWPEFENLRPPSLLLLSSARDETKPATGGKEPYRTLESVDPHVALWIMSGWRIADSGMLEIVSSDGYVGFTMTLEAHGNYLLGSASLFSDVGGGGPQAKVKAIRVRCPQPEARRHLTHN
jgi:hypothetical protein